MAPILPLAFLSLYTMEVKYRRVIHRFSLSEGALKSESSGCILLAFLFIALHLQLLSLLEETVH